VIEDVNSKNDNFKQNPLPDTANSILLVDKKVLKKNSIFLEELQEQITKSYKDLEIESKYTFSENKILSGITIDGRNLSNWNIFSNYKKKIEKEIIIFKEEHDLNEDELIIQTYKNHPFIDLYSCLCSKSMAFDSLTKISDMTKDNKILYLGDSENDNPVFKKADISIGIKSDKRINTKLECKYYLDYENLVWFLYRLNSNNFIFTEDLLNFDITI
jgi:hydroxymethylpyrimidine pyrophosphatase-like HAD family hydrolase